MHLKCKGWKGFWRKQRLQKCPNGQVTTIFARSPKPRIFGKSAKGGPRKIFQESPKKWPSLQKAQITLAQMALALIVQRLEKILAQKAVPKGPEWPSYSNLGNVTQNPHFLKKCKGGTKRNFSKIAQKVVLA